jgi:hypothetical protein
VKEWLVGSSATDHEPAKAEAGLSHFNFREPDPIVTLPIPGGASAVRQVVGNAQVEAELRIRDLGLLRHLVRTRHVSTGSGSTETETRYMHNGQHQVNSVYARNLSLTETVLATFADEYENRENKIKLGWGHEVLAGGATEDNSITGEQTLTVGINVFKVSKEGTKTLLSDTEDPVAQATRSSDGIGWDTGTWSCPATSLVATDAIYVQLVAQMTPEHTNWFPLYYWITPRLNSTGLLANTWTVNYYTEREYDGLANDTLGFVYNGAIGTEVGGYTRTRITGFKYTLSGAIEPGTSTSTPVRNLIGYMAVVVEGEAIDEDGDASTVTTRYVFNNSYFKDIDYRLDPEEVSMYAVVRWVSNSFTREDIT